MIRRAAGESFADVVVGIAFERQRDAFSQECAEALAGGAGELEANGIVGQARVAVAAGDFAAELAPTVRCVLRMGSLISMGVRLASASPACSMSL